MFKVLYHFVGISRFFQYKRLIFFKKASHQNYHDWERAFSSLPPECSSIPWVLGEGRLSLRTHMERPAPDWSTPVSWWISNSEGLYPDSLKMGGSNGPFGWTGGQDVRGTGRKSRDWLQNSFGRKFVCCSLVSLPHPRHPAAFYEWWDNAPHTQRGHTTVPRTKQTQTKHRKSPGSHSSYNTMFSGPWTGKWWTGLCRLYRM